MMRTILIHLGDWVSHLAVIGGTLGIVALMMTISPREEPKGDCILMSPAEHDPTCQLCQHRDKHPFPSTGAIGRSGAWGQGSSGSARHREHSSLLRSRHLVLRSPGLGSRPVYQRPFEGRGTVGPSATPSGKN